MSQNHPDRVSYHGLNIHKYTQVDRNSYGVTIALFTLDLCELNKNKISFHDGNSIPNLMFMIEAEWMHHLNNVSHIDIIWVRSTVSYNKVTNLMKNNPRHALLNKSIAMTLSPNKGFGWIAFERLSLIETLYRRNSTASNCPTSRTATVRTICRPVGQWTAWTWNHSNHWTADIRTWRFLVPSKF